MEESAVEEALLEEAVDFLRLENAFLTGLLERLAPGSLTSAAAAALAAAAATTGDGLPPLLLSEKQELCVAEAAAVRREIERVQAEGELERACTHAAVADASTQQAAETARDLVALLTLLGLPAPPALTVAETLGAAVREVSNSAPAASFQESSTAVRQADAEPLSGAEQGPQGEAAVPPDSSAVAAAVALPSARQLARADLQGARLAHFLEEVLARHDADTTRLQSRSSMLQNNLARVEASLSTRAELGAQLRKVDFDALRIEHSQAEAALAAASTDAVALKGQVAAAQQQLAEQRGALASAAAASTAVARQAGVREGQAGVLKGVAGKARRECEALQTECQRLQQKREKRAAATFAAAAAAGSEGGKPAGRCVTPPLPPVGVPACESSGGSDCAGGPSTILEYMRVKNACTETSKRIADWQRKLEVQAGRRAVSGRL